MSLVKLVHLKAFIMVFMISSFIFLCIANLVRFLSFEDLPSKEPETVNEPLQLNVQLKPVTLNLTDIQPKKTIKYMKFDPTFQTFKTNEQKDQRLWTLCNLNLSKACFSNHIAEVIDSFWVVAPLYSFRQGAVGVMYTHHANFQSYMKSIGLKFCTIEAIRKDRNQIYMMTRPNHEPEEIQTEFFDDIYLRENFLNVAIKRIPDWEYVAWIDAHQVFENPYWWEESVRDMEKYGSVQMFQQLQRLDAFNGSLNMDPGSLYVTELQSKLGWDPLPYYGNAFGIRKQMYDQIEYILDTCVASCCDCLYNNALLDDSVEFYYMEKWAHYLDNFKNWTDRARSVFKGKRKSIRGKLFHLKHEEKFSYFALLEAANNMNFSVEKDLKRNEEFVISLENPVLRKEIDNIHFTSYYSYEIGMVFVVIGCIVAIGLIILVVSGFKKTSLLKAPSLKNIITPSRQINVREKRQEDRNL